MLSRHSRISHGVLEWASYLGIFRTHSEVLIDTSTANTRNGRSASAEISQQETRDGPGQI